MKKIALHLHKEAERVVVGEDWIITCQAFPVSITELLTHPRLSISTNRGAQGQVKTQTKDSEEGTACPDLFQPCPRRPSAPSSLENHHKESMLKHLSYLWGLLPEGVRHNLGHRGRDCTGFTMGCLRIKRASCSPEWAKSGASLWVGIRAERPVYAWCY